MVQPKCRGNQGTNRRKPFREFRHSLLCTVGKDRDASVLQVQCRRDVLRCLPSHSATMPELDRTTEQKDRTDRIALRHIQSGISE